MPKATTPQLTPLTLIETSASYLINTSPFLTRSHLSPNLAITVFVSFAVSVHTSIPKQLPPSPLPLFTPSSTTATLLITTCPSLRSPGSNRSRTLLHVLLSNVKAPKSSHITPILWSMHWLKITERIEYKLLSLTYKVLTTTQPSYLHNLITVQPPCSTRSSSLVTLARPSTSSSLQITDHTFPYASPCLWNELPPSHCQQRTNLSNSDSPSSLSGTFSIGSIDTPHSSSIAPSLFHSRLKPSLFCKSFPTQPSFSSAKLIPRIPWTVYRYFRAYLFVVFCSQLFSCWFHAVDQSDSCRLLIARQNSISYRIV